MEALGFDTENLILFLIFAAFIALVAILHELGILDSDSGAEKAGAHVVGSVKEATPPHGMLKLGRVAAAVKGDAH